MSRGLQVHLGRDGPKSVELEAEAIEVTGDFTILIENHGPPQHIHVGPEDELGRFVRVDEPNHFIKTDEVRTVHVTVADERPKTFNGRLRFVTGYGTETTYIEVTLSQEAAAEREVAVDETLGRPRGEEPPSRPLTEQATSPESIPVIGLAAMAIFIAVGAVMIATEIQIVLGVLAVLVGVGIAIVLVLR
ncbi:MAG: hypothetical protein ACLFMX_08185 [Halobacteriales archaeon]